MCVILFVDEKRPSDAMVRAAWKKNDDGGGVAYRVKGEGDKVLVKWEKDLSEEQMIERCKSLPLPYVAHFRIASSGGVCSELCHPFSVDREASVASEGTTEGYVLFHNGDWKFNWSDLVLQCAIKDGWLPEGNWSDTRAMAYLSSHIGMQFMDFIGHKGIAFGPDDIRMYAGRDGWIEVGPEDIWCSNDYFWPKYSVPHQHTNHSAPKYCKTEHCYRMEGVIEGECSKCRYVRHQKEREKTQDALKAEYCTECERIGSISGDGHLTTCSKASKRGPLVCIECKHNLEKEGHTNACSVGQGGFGTALAGVGTGGSQFVHPFLVVSAAENLKKKGQITKQELTRIWKRLIGTHRDTEALETWLLKREIRMNLKDPRVEVVTL